MKGHEITYLLKQNGLKVTDIANSLGLKQPTVTQVIYGTKKSRRIREAISKAIDKPVSEIWPDQSKAEEVA